MPGSTVKADLTLRTYVTGGAGSAGTSPRFVGPITGRLIPQDGARFSTDDWGMDVLSLPFKVARVQGWEDLLPEKGSILPDLGSMYYWNPLRDMNAGKMFIDINLIYKGLISNTLPDPIIRDSTSQQSVTISGDGGTLSILFYAPQTVYKYVTRDDPKGKARFTTVQNSGQRPIRVLRYVINGSVQSNDAEDGGSSVKQSLAPLVEEINVSTTSEKIGGFWQCEDVAIKTLVSPASL